MADDENIDVRVSLKGRQKFSQETRAAKDDVDDFGDELEDLGDKAARATRKLGALGVASSTTRVNIGPLSTTARGGALALGALSNAAGTLGPMLLGAVEAVATLTGGAAGAGGVGLLALAQGSTVAKLGLGGLMDALGGSEEAAKDLTPEVRELFEQIKAGRDELAATAQDGLLPGLGEGTRQAMRNLPVVNRLVAETARTLGALSSDAGGMLGSSAWGRDVGTVGRANVRIIDDLGHAGLFLADAFRHVAVEAAPLAEWLAQQARDGSEFVDTWAEGARASGDMARFFRDARVDLELLGSMTGHGTRGLINLFGAQDVDGTSTLRNMDAMLNRFERWTASPALADGFGDAIIAEIPDLVGAVASSLAAAMPGAAATAANVFVDSFMNADAWGKLLLGGWFAKKLGVIGIVSDLLGGGGVPGGGNRRGMTPANPLFVADVTGGGFLDMVKKGKVPAALVGGALATSVTAAAVAATAAADYKLAKDYHDRNKDRPGGGQPNPHAPMVPGMFGGNLIPWAASNLTTPGLGLKALKAIRGSDEVEVIAAPVYIDGEKAGALQATVLRRRQARN